MFTGFMINAWATATIAAIVAGVVGSFVALRGTAFPAHAIPKGAFAGAAGASLLGISTLIGLAVFSLLGALAIGTLGRRGRQDVVTALALVLMLGASFSHRDREPLVRRLAAPTSHARALSAHVTLRFAYLAVLRMLGWMALRARSELAKDAEILVLRHQVAVLQRHVKTPRPSWADRTILSALAQLIPSRQRSQLRLIASSRTLLRWHADIVKRRWCYPYRRPGRPPVPRSVRDLLLEMARDNPAWGYRRIHGELTGLGYTLAPSTVWKILNDAGIDPAPNRHGQTWRAFLAVQAHTILAADFFHVDTVLGFPS